MRARYVPRVLYFSIARYLLVSVQGTSRDVQLVQDIFNSRVHRVFPEIQDLRSLLDGSHLLLLSRSLLV